MPLQLQYILFLSQKSWVRYFLLGVIMFVLFSIWVTQTYHIAIFHNGEILQACRKCFDTCCGSGRRDILSHWFRGAFTS